MTGLAQTEKMVEIMEMMKETMEMKEAVISYLERSGGLERLVRDCEALGGDGSQQSEGIYRFCVSVRPSEVMDMDARLGDCVLHRPLQATALFQSVCFLAIKTLSLIKKIHTENQVNVVLRLVHLPPLPGYLMDLRQFPRGYGPMRPLLVEGLVVAMTRITKYTQGARFLCTEATCPCSTDKQLVELIHASAVDILGVHPPYSVRFQSVTLFLRDELCNSMKIGKLYRVVGIPAYVHQWPQVIWSVEASSVQPWKPKCSGIISANFRSLLAATACSPWRFSAVVSNMFGSPVVPPGCFSTLKLCLLLSLVQTEGDDSHPLHHLDVLALTNDSVIIDRLMTYGLGLASRGIRHQVTREIQTSLSEDAHGAGTANIHGGDALLASSGICLLGDLATYRKDKLDALQSVLETRTATVFIPGKKYGEDACQQLSFQIQCNFWALDDVATPTKRVSKGNSGVVGSVETGLVPAQIAEAFGLIVQCPSDHCQFPLTVHTLRQAVTPREPLYPACMQFTTQDYQELLASGRELQVELSPQAEKMIHGYYMASRRVRSMLSVTSLRLLISLAEAHSKLSLRTRVLQEDAVLAVLLCEATLSLKYGVSALVLPPDAVFPYALHDVESLHRRDVALQQLQQQILQFVYSYAPGSTSYTAEE